MLCNHLKPLDKEKDSWCTKSCLLLNFPDLQAVSPFPKVKHCISPRSDGSTSTSKWTAHEVEAMRPLEVARELVSEAAALGGRGSASRKEEERYAT